MQRASRSGESVVGAAGRPWRRQRTLEGSANLRVEDGGVSALDQLPA